MVSPQEHRTPAGGREGTSRLVAWRRSGTTQTDEHCRVTLGPRGISLQGTVLGAEGGSPVRIDYLVVADGLSMRAQVGLSQGAGRRGTRLVRATDGRWTVDGVAAPALEGCTDVDLGCTPATNTLPLRRLGLDMAAPRTIRAAWVRFPELTVAAVDQTYTRLGERRYHYTSGSYTAELTVDDLGLVTEYDEWRRTGVADPS